jgi:hypothetical protein
LIDNINHESLLAAILKTNLDKKDERFQKLCEDLVEHLNKREYYVATEDTNNLIHLLTSPDSPVKTPFAPKYLESLKKVYAKEAAKNTRISSLYREAQVVPALKALGYTDVEGRVTLPSGFQVALYSKEHNTVFVGLDSTNLCYDRSTPDGNYVLHARTLEALPEKPKVYTINMF